MGSALVAVRTGLITALATLTGTGEDLENVSVSYAYPRGPEKRETIYTSGGKFNHSSASLRATKTFRNEVGTFDVRVLVRGISLAQETTSARAIELGVVVEDFVATHVNWTNSALGVAIQTLTVDGDGELVEAFNDKGTLAELSIPIRYSARLT